MSIDIVTYFDVDLMDEKFDFILHWESGKYFYGMLYATIVSFLRTCDLKAGAASESTVRRKSRLYEDVIHNNCGPITTFCFGGWLHGADTLSYSLKSLQC